MGSQKHAWSGGEEKKNSWAQQGHESREENKHTGRSTAISDGQNAFILMHMKGTGQYPMNTRGKDEASEGRGRWRGREGHKERKRQREGDTKRHTDRDRHKETETDTQTDRERDRQSDREKDNRKT